MRLFHRLEEDGLPVQLPWNKVTVLFNLARLLEQMHNGNTASLLYRLILFKVCISVFGFSKQANEHKDHNVCSSQCLMLDLVVMFLSDLIFLRSCVL